VPAPARRTQPALSKGYTSGKGATGTDVQTLINRYVQMHGRAPSQKQIAKIRRSK
jgi:hypothetical protein